MATPGRATGANVIQTPSLIPLVQQISNTLDFRETRERREKEALNQQFKEEIASIDYTGLTTDQTEHLKNKVSSLIDLNANLIRNAGDDPRAIDSKPILREQNKIRALGEKWRAFDQEISTVNKALEMDKDGIYDKEAMNNAMIGMTYEIGPDGKRRAREDVQTGEAIAMLDNPAFMDPDAFIKREINKLDEIVWDDFETQNIPGFGMMGFETKQKTKIPWQLDENGEPLINPETGEKQLDLESWSRIVLNDPNTRKAIRNFAAREGMTVNEWLNKKGKEHNATPKTFERILYPRVDRTTSSDRNNARKDDVRKVFLDTVSGLLQQQPELVERLPQVNELDEDNVPYRDATQILSPYKLTTVDGSAVPFAAVYLSDGNPGAIYVKDTERDEPRKLEGAEITNMINAAGTLNTALREIDSYGLRQGYVRGDNTFNPNVNVQQNPIYLQGRQGARKRLLQEREASQAKLKNIASTLRQKKFYQFLSPKQKEFSNEINEVLKDKTIKIPNEGAYGRPLIVENPTVDADITFWGKENRIEIKNSDGETVASLSPVEFADLIDSPGFIVGDRALQQRLAPEEEPGTTETKTETKKGSLDNLGMPQ